MLYRELKQSLVDIEKMFGLINEEPDIKDKVNFKKIPDLATLNFENVSFSYGSRLILKDLNFTLQPGKTTAIVVTRVVGKVLFLSCSIDFMMLLLDESHTAGLI